MARKSNTRKSRGHAARKSDKRPAKRPVFDPADPRSIHILQALSIFAMVVLGLLIYANTLQSPFIFDDEVMILNNPAVRMEELSWQGVSDAVGGMGRNRPVSTLSFALNYYLDRYHPFGYHLVNIVIHVITGVLLYFFLNTSLLICRQQQLLNSPPDRFTIASLSALAALLWLVSPVQTQSVTYIVQRTNSMAAMFFVLSMWLYARGRVGQRRAAAIVDGKSGEKQSTRFLQPHHLWYFGCVIAGILAWGSKENAVMLPFIILLYEWYFFQNLSKKWISRQLIIVVAILILFGVMVLIHLGLDPWQKFQNLRDFSEGQFTIAERMWTQTRVVVYYLSLIFFPHPSRLNLEYDFPLSRSLLDPFTTSMALLFIIALITVGVWSAKKQRLISFSIFWFLGNLVVESSVIPLAIIFEHRLYLPSMLAFLPVLLAGRYIKPIWVPVGAGALLVAVSAYWTVERNKVWQDHMTMWTDCIRKSPNKARPYANLANAQKKRGMMSEALQNYRTSIRLDPDLYEAHYNLGVLLAEQSKPAEAIEHYRKAVRIKPDYAEAHNNLGAAYQKTGNPLKAKAHVRKALQIKPDFALACNNLGFILAGQGEYEEAAVYYRRALQIDPDLVNARKNLGFALQQQNKLEQAAEHYRQVLKVAPDDTEVRVQLAAVLTKLGQDEAADEQIRKTQQATPDDAYALNNLGGQLLKQGKPEAAAEYFKRAIDLDPNLAEAHNNLGIILIRQGNLTAAISHFEDAVRINSDFGLAQNNLERALAIREGIDRQIRETRTALETGSDDPALRFKLGNLYLRRGDRGRAIAEFEKCLVLKPDYVEAQNNLAMTYAADRQYDQALAAFKKLAELDPDNSGIYYNIAVLYALQDKVPESVAWLETAINRGYRNWDLIKTDPDLAGIRDSDAYKQLIKGH